MKNNENLLIGLPEIQKKLGLSQSSLYRLRACEMFPPPYHAKKWKRSDIDLWLNLDMPSKQEFLEHKKLLCKKVASSIR